MEKTIGELPEKINRLKRDGKLDLSSDEDLSLAVMNLISIEEHLFFSGAKTGKGEYYDCLNRVRTVRQELLRRLVGKTEGEVWCVSKHLLAASMRLIEVGTKCLGRGDKKGAEDFFAKAWGLYSLFWEIRLGLVEVGELRKTDDEKLKIDNKEIDLQAKLDELIKRLIDCCE